MTITSTPSEITYAGDGVSTVFTIPFVFDTSADLKVVETVAGLPTVVTTGFSIAGGAGLTGTLTRSVALPIGTNILILDNPALTQPVDYVNNDAFPATTHEGALDRLTRITKRLNERVDRSLRVADGDLIDGDNNLLPIASVRAGKFGTYDAQGRPSVASGTGNDSALRTDLAVTVSGSDGARLVGYRSTDTGSVARSVYSKLRDFLDVRDFGASTGASASANKTAIQAAITAAPNNTTLLICEAYTINSGLQITNKVGLEICGGGSLTFVGASSAAIMFEMVGTCSDIDIHDLSLAGEANGAYTQSGVANFSGQTISDCRVHDLFLTGFNVGVSFNAATGTFTRSKAYNLTMTNIVGTVAGSGYGMHVYATNCQMANILVSGAQRHSFYQAGGSGNQWSDLFAINNKVGVGVGSYGGAMAIFRSSHVHVNGLTVQGFADGALVISHDTSTLNQCNNIVVENVKISGRTNVIPAITIGEQAVPGTYETTNVSVRNVDIYEDDAVANGGYLVYVFNGRFVRFTDVRLTVENMSAALFGIGLGDNVTVTDDADCNDISFDGVVFDVSGATPANFLGFRTCSDICALTSRHSMLAVHTSAGIDVNYFDGVVTNPNLLTTDTLSASGAYDPPNLADGAGTTTTLAVTGAAMGDFAQASFSLDLQGIVVIAYVSVAGTVAVRFQNESGGALDLASGTLRAWITKKPA